MLSANDLTATLLTLKLAAITTVLLLLIAPPIAWWLAKSKSRWRTPVEALVALPLILPPTVLGFYLLIIFAPQGEVGQLWTQLTGTPLAFSFAGLVFGSIIYSMPFVVQPLQSAFAGVDNKLLQAATTMGASKLDQFFSLTLPLTKRSFITAASLGFAHTIGEFGVVLMIGGNIPGETQVLSIALFDHVESMQYDQAHSLAALLLIFSLLLLLPIYAYRGRGDKC